MAASYFPGKFGKKFGQVMTGKLPSSNKQGIAAMTTELVTRLTRLEKGHELMQETLSDHDRRLTAVEGISEDVSAIRGAIDKGFRQLRFWAPTIVAAAISAGIVNGKLGAFLNALFTGT